MPLNETSGNLTTDAFGGGVAVVPTYIEDVFSTWLYTGTGSSQTITNNIDLSTKGGLTWIKSRSAATDHKLTDTARGATKALISDTIGAQTTDTTGLTAFGTTGFTIGANTDYNTSAATYASWTFRKQPKFFDVVTFTAGSSANARISHSLGSVPGFIVIKALNNTDAWYCYTSTTGISNYLRLDSANPTSAYTNVWGASSPTTTDFGVNEPALCYSGQPYVAYLFASNAGGFGLTGTDNVISCGSYVGTGVNPGPTINLGYEPQFVIVKDATLAFDWLMYDTMRGMPVSDVNTGNTKLLRPSTSGAESGGGTISPTATGFQLNTTYGGANAVGDTYIYIAIRRGPMKVPTVGTSVYESTAYTGNNTSERKIGSSVLTDLLLLSNRDATADSWASFGQYVFDRLRGQDRSLGTANTSAEVGGWTTYFNLDMNTGWDTGSTGDQTYFNKTSSTFVSNAFRRAPSFMDVVCYTGDGGNMTISHNLGVVPTLMIVRGRNATGAGQWKVYDVFDGNDNYMALNTTAATASGYGAYWNTTTPTSTVFYVGSSNTTNTGTYVAYLFATCAGVSKVGSYTGNGTTQTINCGFTGGARFVLIKRTDSTGGWYVYDTARGMTTLTDPYLFMNSTAAETATLGSVTTVSTGFALNATILAAINTNAATYIYLAIA